MTLNIEQKELLHRYADDYGLPYDVVYNVVELLGTEEIYDGVPSTLNDISLSDEYL